MMRYWPFILFIVFIAFLGRGLHLDPHRLPSTRIGQPLPVFELPSLSHQAHGLKNTDLRGKKSLLNVWASWCHVCEEEQVFLLQLAHAGVPIYGLSYKDDPQQARQWLNTWGNPYVAIGQDQSGQVAIDLGVYGTPETFLIDERGVIQYRHVGALTEAVWQNEFLPRMSP